MKFTKKRKSLLSLNKKDKKTTFKSKLKEQELKKAYRDFAKNKRLKKELATWDEAVGDGVNNE